MLSWMRLRSACENLERSVLLGMYWRNKAICILVTPSLPGTVRVTEVDLDSGSYGDLFMSSQFTSLDALMIVKSIILT